MSYLKFDIEFKKEQENLINIFFNNYDFIDIGNARVYHLDYVYDYEIWEKALMAAGDKKCDWTDKKYIEPIIECINQ